MNTIFKITVILFIFLIDSCSSNPHYHKKNQLEGQIAISGAFALYPIATIWAEEFMKIYPDVTIDISAGGAGKGMTDALSHMVDLGMVSRGISPEEIQNGAWSIAVVKDAVVPTVNIKNPYIDSIKVRGITKKELKEIFIDGHITDWGQLYKSAEPVNMNVFTRSDACGAAEMWGKYLGHNQESLIGVGVFGDPGMADAVKNNVTAIGYNNVIYAYNINTRRVYDGIVIVPIDLNENGIVDKSESFYDQLDSLTKAIREGRYPSPPARDLFFVSNGKPERKVVKEFLKWVLTDGQKYVDNAGYVELPNEHRLIELSKIRFLIPQKIRLNKSDSIN